MKILLQISGLAKSVYYYTLSKIIKDEKNKEIINKIKKRKKYLSIEQEDKYETIDDLIKAIDDYIYYYNHDRIKEKLKGLSPVNYRLQSSN